MDYKIILRSLTSRGVFNVMFTLPFISDLQVTLALIIDLCHKGLQFWPSDAN